MSKSTGILLINLGSPSDPTIPAIRAYLKEFLMDPYVLQMPFAMRALLVHGLIAPFRPKKTLKNYLSIWTQEGSPLIKETQKLTVKLRTKLSDQQIEFAMRYGKPNFESALKKFKENNISNIKVIPLYPQYALSATLTAQVHLDFLNSKNFQNFFQLTYLKDFYAHPSFIASVTERISKSLEGKTWDKLLISFHGLPKSHLSKKVNSSVCSYNDQCCDKITSQNQDCYRAQCFETARLIASKLGLNKNQYDVGFQSRLTRGWVEPFTDKIIDNYKNTKVKKLAIVCPSFVSDCLETLEEISIGERTRFLNNGGEEFHYVPCVNDDEKWVSGLAEIIQSMELT